MRGVGLPSAVCHGHSMRRVHADPGDLVRTRPRLARASAAGAVALAAAQIIDMRVTGRPPSDTPVRGAELLAGRPIEDPWLRTVVGYAVQSSLGAASAAAAAAAGDKPSRRLRYAILAPLTISAIINPAFGVSTWPSHWTRADWERELANKTTLAVAVVTAL
jgi:hypothetical protein